MIRLLTIVICIVIISPVYSFNEECSGWLGYTVVKRETVEYDDVVKDEFDKYLPDSGARAGLSCSSMLADHWSVFAQAYLNPYEKQTQLSHLSVNYDSNIVPIDDKSFVYGFRVGKLRNDFGLYQSSAINPATTPGVNIPRPVYDAHGNDIISSGYGINPHVTYGDFKIDVFLLNFKSSLRAEQEFLGFFSYRGENQKKGFDYAWPFYKSILLTWSPSRHWTSISSYIKIDFNSISTIDIGLQSLRYSSANWSISGDFAYFDKGLDVTGPARSGDINYRGTVSFLYADYDFTHKTSLFGSFGVYTNVGDIYNNVMESTSISSGLTESTVRSYIQSVYPQEYSEADDNDSKYYLYEFGLKYHYNDSWTIKASIGYTRLTRSLRHYPLLGAAGVYLKNKPAHTSNISVSLTYEF